MRGGSDHEGDGGWPYRDVKREQEEIKRLRPVIRSRDQDVLAERSNQASQPRRLGTGKGPVPGCPTCDTGEGECTCEHYCGNEPCSWRLF
jgi:hypothetical protein